MMTFIIRFVREGEKRGSKSEMRAEERKGLRMWFILFVLLSPSHSVFFKLTLNLFR